MKICIVVVSFPNVSETFILNKVAALASHGHKVQVVCEKRENVGAFYEAYSIKSSQVTVHNLLLPTSIASILKQLVLHPALLVQSFSLSSNEFKKRFKDNFYIAFFSKLKPDIIHFEFSGLGVSFLSIIDHLKYKSVVSCRGTAEKLKLQFDEKRKVGLTTLFSKVDLIHCVSNDMKLTILPYCTNTEKIFINTPAIDPNFFQPAIHKKQNTKLIIVSVGRLTFLKGYIIGFLAMKELKAKGIEFEWKIIGDGSDMELLLFHRQYLNLKNEVFLLGKRNKEEINEILGSADIFMLTSFSEGIPNVVLEAMSKELPVVCSKCGGIEEVITQEEDGFLADIYDYESIAKYIIMLADNDALRKKIGVNARKKITEKFTLQQQTQIFEKHYRTILQKK